MGSLTWRYKLSATGWFCRVMKKEPRFSSFLRCSTTVYTGDRDRIGDRDTIGDSGVGGHRKVWVVCFGFFLHLFIPSVPP